MDEGHLSIDDAISHLLKQNYAIPKEMDTFVQLSPLLDDNLLLSSVPVYDGWIRCGRPVIDKVGLEFNWNMITGELLDFVRPTRLKLDLNAEESLFPPVLEHIPPNFERGLESFDGNPSTILHPPKTRKLQPFGHRQRSQDEKKINDVAFISSPSSIDLHAKEGSYKHVKDVDPKEFDPKKSIPLQASSINRMTVLNWARPVDANHIPVDYDSVVCKPAFKYEFSLDPFQKQAIYHLERGESVFVAAHTSAGKTAIAEYAIALASKHLTKAVYTSPIKALSNQKFRDFKETFGEVGLLTGDVQICPDAPCLIMTTEILRSMLYKGSNIIRDMEFVIFDEVHYVNDQDRGVVWEEAIIMLPPETTLILLSATIPNTLEFADWVGRTKQKEIFVISTPKRPVPLEHYLYSGKELAKIVDSGRNFVMKPSSTSNLVSSSSGMSFSAASSSSSGGSMATKRHDRNIWIELSYHLINKNLLPVVIFTFSKRKCEENAESLLNLDLTNAGEKSFIHVFLQKNFSCLKGTDSQLPQILRMRDRLSRGIAVHHSGLLPIMKEAVEILFSKGLIRMLFATETFAMGVNMPARTVAFSSLKKHDGTNFRLLLPGEYTQMAGRAGRRGIDTIGTVIIVPIDEVPSELTLRQVILGTPTKLTSQFRLTYNMILNLLRVEAIRVEEMLRQSFSENITQKSIPVTRLKLEEDQAKLGQLRRLECITCERDLGEYYSKMQASIQLGQMCWDYVLNDSKQMNKYFVPGRLLILNKKGIHNAVGMVLKVMHKAVTGNQLLVLVYAKKILKEEDESLPIYPFLNVIPSVREHEFRIESLMAKDIQWICRGKIDDIPPFSTNQPHPKSLSFIQGKMLDFLLSLTPSLLNSELSELDVMGPFTKSYEVEESRLNRQALLKELRDGSYYCTKCPNLLEHYSVHHELQTLTEKLAELQFKLSEKSLALLPEYRVRVDILKKLDYIDPNSNVMIKGKVACEINTANELITTELLFDNFFGPFNAAESVALLSSLIFKEKNVVCSVQPEQQPLLLKGCDQITKQAQDLWKIQRGMDLDISMDQYIEENLQFALVNIVHEWALGRPFREICELSDASEGAIVRVIVRLDETCREIKNAARIVGDIGLAKKMEEASVLIRRDICFASSLYY